MYFARNNTNKCSIGLYPMNPTVKATITTTTPKPITTTTKSPIATTTTKSSVTNTTTCSKEKGYHKSYTILLVQLARV